MKFKAFTLIELMVVVAIMSILATMGVTNFSSAIARARNAARQNDVLAVSKAMETCYNMTNAIYWGANPNPTGSSAYIVGSTSAREEIEKKIILSQETPGTAVDTPFAADSNGCLNQDILPSMDAHPYYIQIDKCSPQNFIICAELENAAGVESLANVQGGTLADGPTFTPIAGASTTCGSGSVANIDSIDLSLGATACDSDTDTNRCWFCVKNSQ